MSTVLRAFLPALALLSLLVFSHPASADMVPTPGPASGGTSPREEALAELKLQFARAAPEMPQLAQALEAMPTADLLALRAASDSTVRAGRHHSHAWFWWTIGIFITLWWLAFDHDRFHHHCH
jgi:hypothetical protein